MPEKQPPKRCPPISYVVPLLVCAVLPFRTASAQDAASKATPKDWIQLFNGKNLDGWTVKITKHELNDNYKDTFTVQNGLLRISSNQYGNFDGQYGHIFYKDKFSYYLIAVEYRFFGEQTKGAPAWAFRNNGIMLHSEAPEKILRDQEFPTSIEAQLLGGDGVHDRPNGNVCTPGTNIVIDGALYTTHCYDKFKAKTFHGDQWVRVIAEVYGSEHITHFVEGVPVLTYYKPQLGGPPMNPDYEKRAGELLSEGYIALQSESHGTEFRKVELLNLVGCMDPKASNYKRHFVKADNSVCTYK